MTEQTPDAPEASEPTHSCVSCGSHDVMPDVEGWTCSACGRWMGVEPLTSRIGDTPEASEPCKHEWGEPTPIEGGTQKRCSLCFWVTWEASEPTPDASTVDRLADALAVRSLVSCAHRDAPEAPCWDCFASKLVDVGVGFVADARREERERCARECDRIAERERDRAPDDKIGDGSPETARWCAASIRALSEGER